MMGYILKVRDENGNFIGIPAIRGEEGKGAYEHALEGGFVGTEEEFNKAISELSPSVTPEIEERLDAKADKSEVYTKAEADARTGGAATPEMYGAKGDGVTDDTKAIQNCLNENRLVRFSADKTYFTSANLYIPSDTTIFGYGAKVCTSSNLIFTNEHNNTTGGYGQAKNISLYGLDLSAPIPSVCTLVGFAHCENIKIIDCTFHDIKDWHMIELSATKNAVVENCYFYNYAIGGVGTEVIQLDCMYAEEAFPWFGPYDNTPCENIKIVNCNFETETTSTSYYKPSAIGNHSNAQCKDVIIDKCTITGFNAGFKFQSFDGLTITNCNVNSKCGFVALNTNTLKQNLIIKNNVFTGWLDPNNLGTSANGESQRGILLYQPCMNVLIDGCEIKNFDNHGITPQASNVIVQGCKIYDNGGSGLYGGYKAVNETYRNNYICGNGLNTNIAAKYDLQYNSQTRIADEKANVTIVNNDIGVLNIYYVSSSQNYVVIMNNTYDIFSGTTGGTYTFKSNNFNKTSLAIE